MQKTKCNDTKTYKIALLPGDYIGEEITSGAVKIMERVGKAYGVDLQFTRGAIGGAGLDEAGHPFPEATKKICKESDAVFLGAVGGPKWDDVASNLRPERGLLEIRKELGVFANLRPVKIHSSLRDKSPLKESIIGENLDILIVRELIGGIYFGEKGREGDKAYDVMSYSAEEVERIAEIAFQAASKRDKRVTSVDKANVLESSKLWRETVEKVAKKYPEVELSHLYVDNAAMQLVINPRQFDVILTSNMFGDILSDEASVISGSIGMLPSASLGKGVGLFEPIHGSAPDIAGQDKVNPMATILSGAMMLRHSFDMEEAAKIIEKAVEVVLEKGYRTGDIYSGTEKLVGTKEIVEKIMEEIEVLLQK
ncbi:3-isopropylmalate dehydrogenase [uncultured Ilyobacter sp.]|uniref:3-isopropylmalate dehydrogenase n=1 Tax=uncultured Ilyobacter sp. TaxID=544433 RepID=UPI0029F5A3C1|nr:3-isopropylmalate dehydrogenase [uncultured Ilyobacter sp.]